MGQVIVRSHYTPGRLPAEDEEARVRRVRAALAQATGYLLRSDRHGVGEPRTLFDARTDGLDLAIVRAALAAHLGERAAFHRLTLALHPSLDVVSEPDVQRWTRAVLAAGSSWLGADRPAWVAATHRDTGAVHVHVVLAGRDRAGRNLVLRPPFFAHLRAVGQRAAERIQQQRLARAWRLAEATGEGAARRAG